MGLTLAMTLIFEFSRSYVILTIWWPRSGVRIYQIVTGVTSVVGVPSTHLVFIIEPSFVSIVSCLPLPMYINNTEPRCVCSDVNCQKTPWNIWFHVDVIFQLTTGIQWLTHYYWPIVRGIHWLTVDYPHHGPAMWSFGVLFVVSLSK